MCNGQPRLSVSALNPFSPPPTAFHRLPPPVLRSYRVLRCPRPCAASLRRAARQVALALLFTHARGSRDAAERVELAGRRCGLRPRGLSAWAPWQGGGHNTTDASWVFSSSGHRLPSASTAGCLPQRTSTINEAPLEPLPCGIHAPFAVTRRAYALIPNSRRNRGQQL